MAAPLDLALIFVKTAVSMARFRKARLLGFSWKVFDVLQISIRIIVFALTHVYSFLKTPSARGLEEACERHRLFR